MLFAISLKVNILPFTLKRVYIGPVHKNIFIKSTYFFLLYQNTFNTPREIQLKMNSFTRFEYVYHFERKSAGRSFFIPDSRDRLTFNSEWKLSDATCGRPHRSVPSCTSSSYLIHRAVSFHSRSSPVPFSSSSWTNTFTNRSWLFMVRKRVYGNTTR